MLAMGVADYDDDTLDLQYPTKDTEDIVAALTAQQGKFYDALGAFQSYERALPGNPNTVYFRGQCLERMGRKTQAAARQAQPVSIIRI